MKKYGVIIVIAIVLVIGLGAILLGRNSNKSDKNTSTSSTPATSNTPASPTPADQPVATQTTPDSQSTVTYGDSGFSPATLTVKAGTTVTIKNDSSRLLQFDSDPHPEHTDDPELNVGTVSPGQSKTVTVTTTGSHGYHNHLNDSDKGTLVVQ